VALIVGVVSSAWPRRFRLPASVGRLVIEDGRVRSRLLALDV
jgi:hypothetical protein